MNSEYEVMVTVICLSYNQSKYIRKTLDGFVLQKTNFNFEVLVHDDASTDDSPQIIMEYAEKYPDIIKPILQDENQYSKNVRITEKILLPKCKGKYIAFCEGDDYWCYTGKLQEQFDVMEKNESVTICTHIVQCINEDGTRNIRVIPEENYGLQKTRLINQKDFANLIWLKNGYPFHTSSYFIRISSIDVNVMSQLCTYLNGDDVFIRMSLYYGDCYFISKVMSCRRLSSIGSWNSRMAALSDEDKLVFRLNKLKGNIYYDRLTNGKYHEEITSDFYHVLSSRMESNQIRTIVLAFYEKYKEEYELKDVHSVKIKLKWILFRYFPYVNRLLRILLHNKFIKGH